MKSFLFATALLLISIGSQAQYGGGGMGMGGGGGRMRGGEGMHNRNGNFQNREFHKSGSGNLFTAELKDGTKVSGAGTVKIKDNSSTLTLKTRDGKEFVFTPAQLSRLSHATRTGTEDYINFENKYWLCKMNKNVELFYQAEGEDKLVFMKENDKFRIATKNDIIDLVKDDKDAYKYAKKGQIKKSLQAYIGTDTPVPTGLPEKMEGDKKKPLFNAE